MRREQTVSIWAVEPNHGGSTPVAAETVLAGETAICGGGRESNPPTESPRRTGFEDQEGHQAPVASGARIPGVKT